MSRLGPRRIFVLEERELPNGKWHHDEDQFFEVKESFAQEKAEDWANMDYEGTLKLEVRVVEYRRVRIIGKTVRRQKKKEP